MTTYPALVYYNGTLYDGMQIHARGNTSRSWPKKNWKFYTARNHDFFMPGLTGIPVDNFNFQASYSDKTYTRENLSWQLFKDVGEPYLPVFSCPYVSKRAIFWTVLSIMKLWIKTS